MNRKVVKKTILIILSAIASVMVAALAALLLASGIFTTPKYLEPWDKEYAGKLEDPRLQLAAHGLLAASGHNAQPWKIRLDQNNKLAFLLYADSERLTLQVDPLARQTMVSQGTFLENVRIAAEKLGYEATITLFPEGEYDESRLVESMKAKPVARVVLIKTQPENSSFYEYMFLPDTNRGPYQPETLTADQLKLLSAINDDDADIKLSFYQDQDNLDKLGRYAIAGAEIESRIHRINEEAAAIFRANERQKNKYRSGFSVEGQGTTGFMKHILQGLVTLVPSFNNEKNSADQFVKSTQTAVKHTPAYSMIVTKDNSRLSQVKSGMLYGRLVLALHSLGFAAQPPSQVLEEYEEMNEQYRNIHGEYAREGGTIQMFIRLGKPEQKVPLTMRRDVQDLLLER
ncbi:Acg family FMN-binding oxidoreductase [Paenibacillus sp. URB8-2]|uniref:Acg family FMN-binding oxidoreductase n=1 Tax=Paenibacillus sp. URB8-2 TaxID=2741301 RepID=UPI0015BD799A|nr:hypothetical protein [Paenibacillus sp. URB8-2]BCG60411.1 hypothetical protein PUR_38360 [Paenibacillus sp. URB8-2]